MATCRCYTNRRFVILAAICFVVATAFYLERRQVRNDHLTHLADGAQTIRKITKKTVTDGPVTVVALAYMRGGSSLFGQLFQNNPEAFYWFESLIGVYYKLYGVQPKGFVPIDISYYTNGTVRDMFEYEQQAVIQSIDNMLSCNMQNLPVEILGHRFLFREGMKQNYTQCLQSKTINIQGRLPVVNIKSLEDCQSILDPICSSRYRFGLSTNCYDMLQSQSAWSPNGTFAKYHNCLSRIKSKVNACLDYLQAPCLKSKVRALKALRMNMETATTLLKEFPDIKIIHYVRDPRGILKSRADAKSFSPQAKGNIVKEATFLCGRMLNNLNLFRKLHSKYPDRMLQLRYEDLVLKPELTITQLHDFLGTRTPSHVVTWLTRTMNASRSNGKFSYSRTNGSATALAWQYTLEDSDIIASTCICEQVLLALGYNSKY